MDWLASMMGPAEHYPANGPLCAYPSPESLLDVGRLGLQPLVSQDDWVQEVADHGATDSELGSANSHPDIGVALRVQRRLTVSQVVERLRSLCPGVHGTDVSPNEVAPRAGFHQSKERALTKLHTSISGVVRSLETVLT